MNIFIFTVFLFLSVSCVGIKKPAKGASAGEVFEYAQQLQKKSYYIEALTYFKKVVAEHMYSKYAKEADLAIADIFFSQKEWRKAISAYTNFHERYPKHPKTEHVFYRLALSHYNQLPSVPDRDLKFSDKALLYFTKHETQFPDSPFSEEVKTKKTEVIELLIKKQWMAVKFHLLKKRPLSALPYLNNILTQYKDHLPRSGKEHPPIKENASAPTKNKKPEHTSLHFQCEKEFRGLPCLSHVKNLINQTPSNKEK